MQSDMANIKIMAYIQNFGTLSHHRQCFGLFMYAVMSSMNMNESAMNMHMVLITYRQVSMAEWTTEPATRDRIPVRFLKKMFFFS
jgi:hypothetical protein